jgi:hypothetical protein
MLQKLFENSFGKSKTILILFVIIPVQRLTTNKIEEITAAMVVISC